MPSRSPTGRCPAGAGFHEAPRGALGHWVHIRDGAIQDYQCIVPSTWNAGQPLEILRTIHSFDTCMACGVHVVDTKRRELARVRVP